MAIIILISIKANMEIIFAQCLALIIHSLKRIVHEYSGVTQILNTNRLVLGPEVGNCSTSPGFLKDLEIVEKNMKTALW